MRQARLDHQFFENEPRSHLGAILLRKRIVTHDELDRALAERVEGELLGEALVRLGICEQAQIDFVDIGVTSVDRRAVSLLRKREAMAMRAIPLRLHPDETVSVAVADPTDETLLPKLKLALGGRQVRLLVTTPSALRAAWATAYN